MKRCLTSCVCGFESFLSLGQEAPVGPVQHGFDLVLRVVRAAGRKALFRADAGDLRGGGGDRKDTERQVVHAVAAATNPQTLWVPDGPKSSPGLTEGTGVLLACCLMLQSGFLSS